MEAVKPFRSVAGLPLDLQAARSPELTPTSMHNVFPSGASPSLTLSSILDLKDPETNLKWKSGMKPVSTVLELHSVNSSQDLPTCKRVAPVAADWTEDSTAINLEDQKSKGGNAGKRQKIVYEFEDGDNLLASWLGPEKAATISDI